MHVLVQRIQLIACISKQASIMSAFDSVLCWMLLRLWTLRKKLVVTVGQLWLSVSQHSLLATLMHHWKLKVNIISFKFQVYVKVLPQTMPHLMAVLKSLVQNIAFASTLLIQTKNNNITWTRISRIKDESIGMKKSLTEMAWDKLTEVY